MNKDTLEKMIKCAKREVTQRKKVYPRLVANGKMKQEDADYEIKMMLLIVVSLEKILNGTAEKQVQQALFNVKEYEKRNTYNGYY